METVSRRPSPDIEPFEPRHLDGAAHVLAMQHARSRATTPALPAQLEAPAAVRSVPAALAEADGAAGVVALRRGVVVGFLIGAILRTTPNAVDTIYVPPRSARVSYGGAAVAPNEDAAEVYRAMYAALAPRWLAAGCLWHDVSLTTVDRDVLRAWFSLGFGLESLHGLRSTDEPVTGSAGTGFTFRQAAPAEASTVAAFVLGNAAHHSGSPVFFPLVPEARQQIERPATEQHLAETDTTYWLAEHDGRPVSMLSFSPGRAGGSLGSPPDSIYLAEAYTLPAARGRGVATALLRHCLGWAHDTGFRWCSVNWDSANLEGSRFWQRHGFRPIAARVYRLLDERILWARPPSR